MIQLSNNIHLFLMMCETYISVNDGVDPDVLAPIGVLCCPGILNSLCEDSSS